MVKEKGFTLIELSIVLIISGLALAGAIEAYKIYSEKQNIENTKSLLADIDQSLKNFPNMIDPSTADPVTGLGGTVFARLPCPDIDADGREDCGMATIRGRRFDGSPNGPNVMVGGLPYTTLGLAMDYATDPYRQPVVYAITQSATQAATYGSGIGAIKITDDDGNESYTNQYTIVATGRLGCEGDGADVENCDGDADFIAAFHTETASDYYDDRVTYHAQLPTLVNTSEPASCEQTELVNMAGQECPNGWKQAFPTDDSISVMPRYTYTDQGGRKRYPNVTKFSPGSYYNIDPETGDYYFTNVPTKNSKLPTESRSIFGSGSVMCEKNESNDAQQKCFTKSVDIPMPAGANPRTDGPSGKLDSYCPPGFHATGTSTREATSCAGEDNQNCTTTNVSSLHCGSS